MSAVTPSASMTASVVNPIIESVKQTFEMMLSCDARRTKLFLKGPEHQMHCVTAVIGLSGDASGSICLSFPKEGACAIVKRMLDEDVHEVNPMVTDAVAELTNIVAGATKEHLTGMNLKLGLPNVIHGESFSIEFPTNSNPLCIGFDSDIGTFEICCGFVMK